MFAQSQPGSARQLEDARVHYEKLTLDVFEKEMGVNAIPRSLSTYIREQKIVDLVHALDHARGESAESMEKALNGFKAYRQTYLDKIKAEIKKIASKETDQFKLIRPLGDYTGKLHLIQEGYERELTTRKEREKQEHARESAAGQAKKKAKVLSEKEIRKEFEAAAAREKERGL
ncbi:MAG TPA: hypothetical protein VME43_08010 [Bryobacteraceae bacterium]|nr:hypothetical protein [Bryobacteraceae bacterium]